MAFTDSEYQQMLAMPDVVEEVFSDQPTIDPTIQAIRDYVAQRTLPSPNRAVAFDPYY